MKNIHALRQEATAMASLIAASENSTTEKVWDDAVAQLDYPTPSGTWDYSEGPFGELIALARNLRSAELDALEVQG